MKPRDLIQRLDQFVAPLGFLRKGTTWNRKSPPSYVDVINLQTSKSGDTVTINSGVLHRDVHMQYYGMEPPEFVDEAVCTVRARVGQLIDGKDVWWSLQDRNLQEAINEKITVYVLPFMQRMHSPKAMEEALTKAQVMKARYPPPKIYLAILKAVQSNSAGAHAVLDRLRNETTGPWQTKIDEVAERLISILPN